MKKLSEHEAWIFLADKFNQPELLNRQSGEFGIRIRKLTCHGLCEAIISLPTNSKTAGVMLARLHALALPREENGFYFPLTRHGARSRAALCRRFAKLTAGAG
jgi:hypothetical protein